MSNELTFDHLIQLFRQQVKQLPDHRKGKNTTYEISDAVLGAFAVFFTQSPSFLANQRQMKRTKGRSNAESLFQIEQIPSDPQIRNLLDSIEARILYPLFRKVLAKLEQTGYLDAFRFLGSFLISLDGTQFFSSQEDMYPKSWT